MENLRTILPKELEDVSSSYASKLCAFLEELNQTHKIELAKAGIEPLDPLHPVKVLELGFKLRFADFLCEHFALMLDE
jgi:hypothetical protein